MAFWKKQERPGAAALLSSALASKRGKAALVAILFATGGSYTYLQVQAANAAKRRRKLRDSLRWPANVSLSHARKLPYVCKAPALINADRPCMHACRASSSSTRNSLDAQPKGPVARRRHKNGQALMPTLKYLFRLAGPKILTLLALAVAKTVLSNRLARLQVGKLFHLKNHEIDLIDKNGVL